MCVGSKKVGKCGKWVIFTYAFVACSNINVVSFTYILGQKSNGPLQTMDCKMSPVRPIFINRISHSSAATARQY